VYSILLILMVALIASSFSLPAYGLEPLERVEVFNTRLVNSFGVPVIEFLNVNQQVQITAEIINKQTESQIFVYIVQIKDENDVIVSLGWISGMLNPGQQFSPALSWSPNSSGTYSAEIFVWDSLMNQDALTDFKTLQIITS